MFSMHNFVFETILSMIGKEPEYKVRQYALGWLEKNILTEDDLAAIEARFAELAAEMEAEKMTVYEAIIAAGAIAGALITIFKLLHPIVADAKELVKAVHEMREHDEEQYRAILRLTIMSREMPLSERIIAGKKYIEKGGNGDVKKYFEQLLEEHTK